MCWSVGATATMVGIGAVATVVTARRGETPAIPTTIGFFTVMELLQLAGYGVIDQCSTPANQWVTALSYIHISLQPIFINAFGLAIVAPMASPRLRRIVFALSGLATLLLLARMLPADILGRCEPGTSICAEAFCTRSGSWHLGWDVPLNNFWAEYGGTLFRNMVPFPDYLLAVFVLPLFYGGWRFSVMHLLLGPVAARLLATTPNEMPAIWCLFAIGLALLALSPAIRRHVRGAVPA